ncbi:hypothetical protein Ssi03_73500 [Sphaerisporangium siamense]|nr:hypothetical protein Ssi03_73500 [Sphaerisporangium siamense]
MFRVEPGEDVLALQGDLLACGADRVLASSFQQRAACVAPPTGKVRSGAQNVRNPATVPHNGAMISGKG